MASSGITAEDFMSFLSWGLQSWTQNSLLKKHSLHTNGAGHPPEEKKVYFMCLFIIIQRAASKHTLTTLMH